MLCTKGCRCDGTNACRYSAIDISKCATCELANDDGYLICEELYIKINVDVTSSSAIDNTATLAYTIDVSTTSPNPVGLGVPQPNGPVQYISSGSNLNIKNGRRAKIVFVLSTSGWTFHTTPTLSSTAWPTWLTSRSRDSSTQYSLTDNGTATNTSHGFNFQLTSGSTTYRSTDPTIINKSDP